MLLSVVIFGCLYAVAATLGLCVAANAVTARLRLMDHPVGRKHHSQPTPLIGGLVVLVAVVPVLAAVCWSSDQVLQSTDLAFLFAITTLALLGLADDRDEHSALIRLAIAALVFAGAAATDPALRVDQIAFAMPKITFVIDRGWLRLAFSTVCYVGLINAINMADGKDGLVPGLGCIWLGFLLYLAPDVYYPLLLVPLVALLALLPFNLRGRVFLGDGGSYGFAAVMALLTVMLHSYHNHQGGRAIAADQIWLLFLIPILDPFRLAYARIRDGKSPLTPGRDHFHHHLQNWIGWPKGLFVYWALVAVPAALNIFFGVNSILLLGLTCVAYVILLSKGATATRSGSVARARVADDPHEAASP